MGVNCACDAMTSVDSCYGNLYAYVLAAWMLEVHANTGRKPRSRGSLLPLKALTCFLHVEIQRIFISRIASAFLRFDLSVPKQSLRVAEVRRRSSPSYPATPFPRHAGIRWSDREASGYAPVRQTATQQAAERLQSIFGR